MRYQEAIQELESPVLLLGLFYAAVLLGALGKLAGVI